ncbi:hypothetical protein [Caballeronia sp. LZ034LL]|uniref:hypothetical protein n=1 Tax=Caballeronia sp. LZ034LL TaxID=3038567 RepID=UPI00286548F4|nr:hypothetical protein [Caballeronia sp. LZ034LL]MDR5839334.1 hypothetical protein [Caballeronia sp. LZ034LL]
MTQLLTKEVVERAVPANLKSAVTPDLVDLVNNIAADPLVAEQVRNNFVSYSSVLKDGKFKLADYIRAVTFVSYRMMNDSIKDAYFKTFPDRMAALLKNGADEKTISAYSSSYAKNKLVNLVLEQTLVPSWVLNAHIYQEAITTQATLMRSAQSEKVRTDAANSLLTHLSKPKEVKALLPIDLKESSGMTELKEMLTKMSQQQRELIDQGVPAKEIAAQRLIDVTDVEAKDIP